jgi:hypothetical protein
MNAKATSRGCCALFHPSSPREAFGPHSIQVGNESALGTGRKERTVLETSSRRLEQPPVVPSAQRFRFRVLDAGTSQGRLDWQKSWLRLPSQEVMAHPDYAPLFARPCDRTVCVVGEEPEGAVLFPLILRPLSVEPWSRSAERRWDAVSPYGYGGPFAWGRRSQGDALFWQGYAQWCEQEGIVSTFARLSLFEEQLACMPQPAEELGRNVVVRLESGAEELWRRYDTKVRRWVRTAERAGLEVEQDWEGARLGDFTSIYWHTMQRNGASPWYYFRRSFFEVIVDRLRGRFVFFHTLDHGKVVSSDLMLCCQEHVYYFLGGTFADAFAYGPNYILKHRALAWAAGAGKKAFVLGGGYKEGDGLIRYKRAFSPTGEVPFRAARLMHSEGEYRALVSDRAAFEECQGRPWAPQVGYFPAYRS